MSKKVCDICGQRTDIYTSVHKKTPFVDGKNYSVVCFTCFFVPKVAEQRYAKDGSLEEEIDVPYGCQSMMSAKELHDQGASDTLKYAKACVEAVQRACQGVKAPKASKGPKTPQRRPEPSWNVC